MTILQVWFPWLRRFRRNSTIMVQAQETMQRIGLQLIDRATQLALEDEKNAVKIGTEVEGDRTTMGRDLLAVLSAFPFASIAYSISSSRCTQFVPRCLTLVTAQQPQFHH